MHNKYQNIVFYKREYLTYIDTMMTMIRIGHFMRRELLSLPSLSLTLRVGSLFPLTLSLFLRRYFSLLVSRYDGPLPTRATPNALYRLCV